MGQLDISPSNQSIQVGQSIKFYSSPSAGPVSWSSSDSSKVRIDADGLATGVAQSATPVLISATDSENSVASTALWVGNLLVDPQAAGVDTGNSVIFRVLGASGLVSFQISNNGILNLDLTVENAVRVQTRNLGVAILTAEDEQGNLGYATVSSGTLLVYGADGTLYLVPPTVWTRTSIVTTAEANVPSFSTMNETPQASRHELATYVPPTARWTTCYVLNPASVTDVKR